MVRASEKDRFAPARRAGPSAKEPKEGAHGPSLLTLDLLPKIRGLLPGMKRAQRQIAGALLEDPERFITHSISDVASNCGVSTASIVLFCKALGLSGFPKLKIALARELASQVFPPYGRNKTRGGRHEVLERVFDESIQNLRDTLRLNSESGLHHAAGLLARARRIVIFSIGLSYSMGFSLYIRLRFMGLPALIEHDSHLQLAAAAEMGARDIAVGISMSGTTAETVECLAAAQARGAKTLCITNSMNSRLAKIADYHLYASPSEIRYIQGALASRVPQLALLDALVFELATRRKRRALAHLERAEEHLLKRRLSNHVARSETR